MFTGLIAAVGTVRACERRGDADGGARLLLELGGLLGDGAEPLALGESLAVDGVCLTAAALPGKDQAACDVAPETLRRTTLGDWRAGRRVNLERALRLGERLGGHLVQGHIDGTAVLLAVRAAETGRELDFTAPPELLGGLVVKGSVALDGISLTVARLTAEGFAVAAIPRTLAATTLDAKRPGDRLNLETDLVGKHVARLLAARLGGGAEAAGEAPGGTGLTAEFLKEHGFL